MSTSAPAFIVSFHYCSEMDNTKKQKKNSFNHLVSKVRRWRLAAPTAAKRFDKEGIKMWPSVSASSVLNNRKQARDDFCDGAVRDED